jgi:hypothetical protein
VIESLITFVRAKAAWRSASSRTPKPRGMSHRHFEVRLQFYLNRSSLENRSRRMEIVRRLFFGNGTPASGRFNVCLQSHIEAA